MLSVTGYFKYLDSPIERIQDLQGGATLHSFKNADNGMAAGVELEMRKRLVKDLRLGANISYMYTNVKLPQGGAYTNRNVRCKAHRPSLPMPTSPTRHASAKTGSSTSPCSTTCKAAASMR